LQRILEVNIKESDICEEVEKLLGKPWNEVLEPFRRIESDGYDEVAGRISV